MQGSKPEISTLRKSMIQHLSNGRLDKIVEGMNDKDYVSYCLQIFEYVMPRMNRVEMSGEEGGAIEIKIIRDGDTNTPKQQPPSTETSVKGGEEV